jgi:hypothetical protein
MQSGKAARRGDMRTLISFRKVAKGLGIGCAAALLSTAAWAVPPYNYTLPPVDHVGVPLIDCTAFGMNFYVLRDYTANEYGRLHYDQDGNWVEAKGFYFETNGRIYNSSDPSRELLAEDLNGAGVHTHFMARYDENQVPQIMKMSGVIFHVVLPGYGALSVNAGQAKFVLVNGVWTVIEVTPHVPYPSVEGAYAICSYLQ